MGYCIRQKETEFFIEAGDKFKALGVIKSLVFNKKSMGGGSSTGERWFSWVETKDFIKAETLEEAMNAWRWEVYTDDDGNINEIEFIGEKLGDDEILFDAIAPFIKSGSYICMMGDDDGMWRWEFNDGKLSEKTGKVIYE